MTPELRKQVIISMTWMIETLKHQWDAQKDPMGVGGTGGYSPDLEEATVALRQLQQEGEQLFEKAGESCVYTEQQCKDAAAMAGGTEANGVTFYLQYAPQDFRYGNGLPITKLDVAMRRWIIRETDLDAPNTQETTAQKLERIDKEKRV